MSTPDIWRNQGLYTATRACDIPSLISSYIKEARPGTYTIVHNYPPFEQNIRSHLEMCSINRTPPITLEDAIRRSREYDSAYIGFSANRGKHRPDMLTGFEPYFIGMPLPYQDGSMVVNDQDAIALHVARLGLEKKKANKALFEKVVTGHTELELLELSELCSIMGGFKATLNPQMTEAGKKFQLRGKQRVDWLPRDVKQIFYVQKDNHLHQLYVCPTPPDHPALALPTLSQQQLGEGYAFMMEVGRAGHPLVRALTNYAQETGLFRKPIRG